MNSAHRQLEYDVRFDWGRSGADAIAGGVAVAVVIDVLSFTTTLSVAMDVGTQVLPWHSRDESAAKLARDNDAVLAVGRSVAGQGQISLSPATLRLGTPPARLVLPSPNGSTIAAHLAADASLCIGASLRNAGAVARWIAEHIPSTEPMAVVAAGERWPGGELRPSIEDLWGAGCLLSALAVLDPSRALSPEAQVAVAAWTAVSPDLSGSLRASASGRELIAAGFDIDVEIAGEMDDSASVPALAEGLFTDIADR